MTSYRSPLQFYVNNYDFICVENLNIKGMFINHNLAQKILEASLEENPSAAGGKAERAFH
ncbi:MAG: hypothetical protein QXO32_02690 [Candidatus Bathyarchaeia archaeon]